MLNIQYTVVPQESANATLDFLSNRPALSLSLYFMKGACALLCFAFAITIYTNSTKPQDYIAVTGAIVWLFFYKKINRKIISLVMRKTKFDAITRSIPIDETNIMDNKWKSFKYILKNRDGYILPLTGFKNAGKFIWLPLRAFSNESIEKQFLDMAAKHRLKIKSL